MDFKSFNFEFREKKTFQREDLLVEKALKPNDVSIFLTSTTS